MKTIDQIIERGSQCLDGRDFYRLTQFLPEEKLEELGFQLNDEFKGKHEPKPFTRENVLAQLKDDVAFGFEKALDKRGLSAAMMFWCVQLWNWVLEEGLENWSVNDYAQYGLPLLKATAVKYDWENPIGDDTGEEDKYASESGD